MKIGVTSDTHSFELPRQLINEFKAVDLIIHAGDFSSIKEVELFKSLAPLKAVYGNTDESSVRALLPERLIVKAEEIRIGITHGRGSRHRVMETVMAAFKKDTPQIVIFGHSHLPVKEKIGNTLYFNPGSPNDKISAPYCSYGLIEVTGSSFEAKIIKVKA